MNEIGNSKKLIVPTADERTWRLDRPILFLGTWCLTEDNKITRSKLNFETAPPYGLEAKQREIDHHYVRELEEKLFPQLSKILNEIHGTEQNERYWRILLGSWFRNYLSLVFNRTMSLIRLTTSDSDFCIVGSTPDYSYNLATLDSLSATHAVNDDLWNHFLILEIIEAGGLSIEKIPAFDDPHINHFQVLQEKESHGGVFLARGLFEKTIKNFSRPNDALIISTYLSLKAELALQLNLGQAPRWRVSKSLDMDWEISRERREAATREFSRFPSDTVEGVIRTLIFRHLPICFLEKYEKLKQLSTTRGYPMNPKFIFTSNSFEFDEAFKIYAAEQTKCGTPIIYGQHGNNYGTSKYISPSIEELTPDKFVTWGWSSNSERHVPAFLFRNASLPLKRYKESNTLLLIENCEEHRRKTWDTHFEHRNYLKEQKDFCNNLGSDSRSNLLVRLTSSSQLNSSRDREFWHEFDRTIKLETGISHIYSLFEQSKIVVHTYDSTGILETLSKNIPTLAFWQNNLDHLRDDVIKDYQMLIDAGIIHLTPKSAASKVNEIWDCVDEWWQSQGVQEARSKFCMKYAQSSQRPVRDLKRILLETANMINSKQ